MRRALVVGLLSLAVAAPSSAASSTSELWAKGAVATVTKAGLFPGTPATFRPADPLTAADLGGLLTAIGSPEASSPADPSAPVTIEGLDAALVDALGLSSTASQLGAAAKAAGLDPPARFGTEVVARLLGLRTDLPVKDDSQEPQPQQTATRAEAAFSAARVLSLGREVEGSTPEPDLSPVAAADAGWGVQYVRSAAATFSLPQLTPLQQEVLHTAVSLIGYPYVWGGYNESVEPGFDCSGFVWRVFKVASYANAPGLSGTLLGRTAAQMAGEVPRRERIGKKALQPADVLFIGNGPRSKAAQVFHTAIYLGNGWLIESSGQGVSLGLLDWYGKSFAWARRPLAEADLEGAAATPG